MLCIICACFTACEMHTHEYQYSVTKEATCEFSGISYGYCSCGKTDEKVIPALGHTFKNDVCSVCGFNRLSDHVHTVVIDEGLPATCESIGLTEGSHCSACNMIITKQEVIPALGHLFMKYTQDNNATCTQDGTKTAVCDREGCNVTDVRVDKDSKKPHSYTAVTVPATCTTAGYVLSTCVCGDKTQEIIPATGHSFTNYVSDNNATCAKNGTKTAICDNSGCSERKTVTDENTKTSHKYTSTTVAPTCVAKGYTLYLCACGDSYMGDYVNTIAHVYNQEVAKSEYLMQEATCKAPAQYYKSCSCGKAGTQSFVYGGTLAHAYSTTWSYSSTHHWYKATCGCDAISRYEMHNSVNGFCSICGIPTESTVGVMYDLSADGTYAGVIGYEGEDSIVVIAKEYQGVPVINIYSEAFEYNDTIRSVVLPNTILSIDDRAFFSCDSLISIEIPNSVVSIGRSAFAFCSGLTSVIIPDSVTSIGESAFSNCPGLATVSIGSGLNIMDATVFSTCQLLNITVSEENKTFRDIAGNLYTKDAKKLIKYSVKKNENLFNIPNGTEVIESGAFSYSTLTSVVMPETLTIIKNGAFAHCYNLTSIEIPNSVIEIEAYAFSDCKKLSRVDISDKLTAISQCVFDGCDNLVYNVYNNGNYIGNKGNPYLVFMGAINLNIVNLNIHNDTKIIAGSNIFPFSF